MIDFFGDNYLLIGPCVSEQAGDFHELEVVDHPQLAAAIDRVREQGFGLKYGYWKLEDASPKVLLINTHANLHELNAIKARMWAHHGISSIDHDALRDEALVFGEATRLLITNLAQQLSYNQDIIAHYHDWLAGTSIPGLIRDEVRAAIVFHAHATLLGRYLAPNEDRYFHQMPTYQWQEMSHRYHIAGRTALEREAARQAHVLVTNSEITAKECECFHGRSPDYIVRNGFDRKSRQMRNTFASHAEKRARIDEFVQSWISPSYEIDTDKTLYFFTSGRYEYHNKGFDITLEAIAHLNKELKRRGSETNIVLFIISKRPVQNLDGVLRSVNQKRSGLPPVLTHHLLHSDEILDFIHNNHLSNQEDSPVKVLYHADFIEQESSVIGLDYLDFVRGCHLGIFPSLYEPWGYAPMETALQSTPVVSSDLSGFGRYMLSVLPPELEGCVRIVHRRYQSDNEAVRTLTNIFLEFVEEFEAKQYTPRVQLTREIVDLLCWTELMRFYRDIYRLALMRHQPVADLF